MAGCAPGQSYEYSHFSDLDKDSAMSVIFDSLYKDSQPSGAAFPLASRSAVRSYARAAKLATASSGKPASLVDRLRLLAAKSF